MGRVLQNLGTSLLVLACLAATPAAAEASSPDTSGSATAIGDLNQQRVANGIPAFTSVDNSLAASWCPNESQGPITESRVLAGGSDPLGFTAGSSPWSLAPLHQVFMYDPLARSAGWATMTNAPFDGGEILPYLECMGFGNQAADPASPTAYTFFSELGPGAVRPTLDVQGEGPFAPQELVGIPQGTVTGPQPIFYLEGMDQVRADSWSLTDQSTGQAVAGVQMVDSYTVQNAGYDPALMWNDPVMVPPALQPGTVYSGQARFSGSNGTCLDETFTFATLQSDGSPSGASVPRMSTQNCGGGSTGSSTGTTQGSLTRVHAARLRMPAVGARWSHGRLVVRARLRHGQRLTVSAAGHFARTRRHVLRLRWGHLQSLTAWVTRAGRTSAHRVLRVR